MNLDPTLCARCGRFRPGDPCRGCGAPRDEVRFRSLGPYDRKAGLGCLGIGAAMLLVSGGGLAALVLAASGWLLILGGLAAAVVVLATLFGLAVSLDMAFASRWEYASKDGSLRGQVERLAVLEGGVGVVLQTESAVARAPRETSTEDAERAGFETVMVALEALGHRSPSPLHPTVRAHLALILAGLTGLSARGELDVTLEREIVWRKPYARRPVVGEPRPRIGIARTGVEQQTGIVEMLLHGVLLGKEAMHRVGGAGGTGPYRDAPERTGMRMSLVAALGEIDAERLTATSTCASPDHAEEVAGAIHAWLSAVPEAADVLWQDIVELARARLEP